MNRPLAALVCLVLPGLASCPSSAESRPPAADVQESGHCGVCGRPIGDARSVSFGPGLDYHETCWTATPRCEICGFPASGERGPPALLKDGRRTCAVCRRTAVLDDADGRAALEEARGLLKSELGLDLGGIDVPLRFVSKQELVAQAAEVGRPAIQALTVVREEAPSTDGARGKRSYRMLALYGIPRSALVAILGHELFHVVQCEVSADERDAAFREGSADYVQVVLLRARGEEARARLLERDTDPTYGEGLRRFERLVQAKGRQQALALGSRSIGFPEGF